MHDFYHTYQKALSNRSSQIILYPDNSDYAQLISKTSTFNELYVQFHCVWTGSKDIARIQIFFKKGNPSFTKLNITTRQKALKNELMGKNLSMTNSYTLRLGGPEFFCLQAKSNHKDVYAHYILSKLQKDKAPLAMITAISSIFECDYYCRWSFKGKLFLISGYIREQAQGLSLPTDLIHCLYKTTFTNNHYGFFQFNAAQQKDNDVQNIDSKQKSDSNPLLNAIDNCIDFLTDKTSTPSLTK